jgi:hypothetical protein
MPKGGQEDDELDWVDIMSDDNESGRLSLNEVDDVNVFRKRVKSVEGRMSWP